MAYSLRGGRSGFHHASEGLGLTSIKNCIGVQGDGTTFQPDILMVQEFRMLRDSHWEAVERNLDSKGYAVYMQEPTTMRHHRQGRAGSESSEGLD